MSAPREMAGKQSKCPACGNSLYVPTPEEEIEELPLAPEDATDLRKEQLLQAERRRLDSLLAHESRVPEVDGEESRGSRGSSSGQQAGAGRSSEPGAGIGMSARIEQALHNYLTAMRDSNLDAAERAMTTLQMQPRSAREMVDRMAADQIPPPEMINVPPGVYQKFLKNLRSRL